MIFKLFICLLIKCTLTVCCLDPGEHFLHQKLNEFIEATLRYEQIELKYDKLKYSITDSIEDNHVFENSECYLTNRTLNYEEQKSICPRQYKIIYRKNKFPYFIKQTVCTCRECFVQPNAFLYKDLYQCLPVWSQRHVLVRDECQDDGYFYWRPDYELVNTGCTCGTNLALISYRSTDHLSFLNKVN